MNKKKSTIFIVLLLITIIFLSGCTEKKEENNNSGIFYENLYVGLSDKSNFSSIQAAINAASNDTTIYVESGDYHEKLIIHKSISIIGENKNTTFIHLEERGGLSQQRLISINANNSRIEGFTLVNPNLGRAIGVYVYSSYNVIKNMVIQNFEEAIELDIDANNNLVTSNFLSNNKHGLFGVSMMYNDISNNIMDNNSLYGIFLNSHSDNNIISGNLIKSSDYGIRVKGSNRNELFGNCFKNNKRGVYCCCGAKYNIIYNNNFMGNEEYDGYESFNLDNTWFKEKPVGGNYWEKYSGKDEDNDGFGDTPYEIPNNQDSDSYPFINPIDTIICEI